MNRIQRVIASFFDKTSAHKFGCLYCPLPSSVANAVYTWGKDNIVDDDLFLFPEGDGGREQNIHVTVKYGIHTNDAAQIQQFITKERPTIKAVLGNVSIFDQPDHQVVKIDVISGTLSRLNKSISNNFKVTDTHPDYKPHVTIAYVKPGKGNRWVGRKDFNGTEIKFERAVFTGSDDLTTGITL